MWRQPAKVLTCGLGVRSSPLIKDARSRKVNNRPPHMGRYPNLINRYLQEDVRAHNVHCVLIRPQTLRRQYPRHDHQPSHPVHIQIVVRKNVIILLLCQLANGSQNRVFFRLLENKRARISSDRRWPPIKGTSKNRASRIKRLLKTKSFPEDPIDSKSAN